MKVLIVTNHYLHGNGGGVYASRAYINAFSSLFPETTVMHPIKSGDTRLLELMNSPKLIPVGYNKNKFAKFIDLVKGDIHRFQQQFITELERNKYDIVVFDNSKCSYRLIDIAKKSGAKVIVLHHNYEYEYNKDNSTWFLKPFMLGWVKRCERDAIQESDLNLTITDQDSTLLKNAFGIQNTRIQTLGCFEYKPFIDTQNETVDIKEDIFVITGNLSAHQTEASLTPWIKDYYPILKDIFPNAKLIIAGKSPSEKLSKLASSYGIEVIASPESMEPILLSAKYYICPTSLGGGLKLRVMDGLKSGLPVVCHQVSARGYDKFSENNLLFVYGNEVEFREQLKNLKEIPPVKTDIKTLYRSVFSFEAGVKRLKQILNGCIVYN